MPHLKALAFKIALVELVWRHLNGDLFGNTETISFQSDHFFGIVGQQTHLFHTQKKRKRLEDAGVRLIDSPVRHGHIELTQLMSLLGRNNITSLLVEGGGEVMASFVASGMVDKIMFFYAPKLLGGNDGVPICRGKGSARMQAAWPVSDIRVRQFDDDIMIEGYMG